MWQRTSYQVVFVGMLPSLLPWSLQHQRASPVFGRLYPSIWLPCLAVLSRVTLAWQLCIAASCQLPRAGLGVQIDMSELRTASWTGGRSPAQESRLGLTCGAQVGRCGRAGQESFCHVLLGDSDFARLRSLSRTNCVDLARVQRFLSRVFVEDQVGLSASLQPACSHEAALVTEYCLTLDCLCAVGRACSLACGQMRPSCNGLLARDVLLGSLQERERRIKLQ